MDAIEFLVKEHDKVRAMLADIDDKSHRFETKIRIFNTMCDDLLRHEAMEHQVWYPHFKNDSRLNDEVKHLVKEENDAEKAIKKLSNIENEKEWQEKFDQFQQDVEHHASEEEEKLFPIVRKILDESKLINIGKEMKEFKEQYNGSPT